MFCLIIASPLVLVGGIIASANNVEYQSNIVESVEVETIELSKQKLYAEQGFVNVDVKNNSDTPIEDIDGMLLISDATVGSEDCVSGSDPIIFDTIPILEPGEQTTISGYLTCIGSGLQDKVNYLILIEGFGQNNEIISSIIDVRSF